MPGQDILHFIGHGDVQVEEVSRGLHEWISRPGLTDADMLSLVRMTMPVGKAHKFHRHPQREEIIYILSGQAEQWVESERRILGAGEAVHIPMNVVHATHNAGDADLIFLAILSPAKFAGPGTIDVSGDEPWASMR